MKANSTKIGHNEGPPLDPGRSWRRHCWKQAHKELWKPLPVEVVRRRVARAARLGLSYRRYAIIRLGGSDVEGLLFTGGTVIAEADATGGNPIGDKLASISGCQRLLMADREGIRFFEAANPERHALFDAQVCVSLPDPPAQPVPRQDRDALSAMLRKQALASRSVALVGRDASGPVWVAAARLAGFVADSEFFAE